MRTRVRLLILFVAVSAVLSATVNMRAAYACSCAGIGGPEKELKSSDAVFTGEVSSVEADETAPGSGLPIGKVVFDLEDSWKGDLRDSVAVYGQGSGISCGLNFDEGKSYLVFAYRSGGDALETDLCTSTQPLEKADSELRALGPPDGELPDTGGPDLSRLALFAAFGVLALAVSAAVISARKRA